MTKTNTEPQTASFEDKKFEREKAASNTVRSQVLVYGSIPVGSLQEEKTRNT